MLGLLALHPSIVPYKSEEKLPSFRKEAREIGQSTKFTDIPGANYHKVRCVIPKVEERGITLRQLRFIYKHVEARCKREKWTNIHGESLTPEKVNLYDVNKYVILPLTEKTEKSFVEMIARKPQKPRWFVSHYWGEPLKDFIECLSQHVSDFRIGHKEEGGQMDETVPVWVCAYANAQWKLDEYLSDDPANTAFAKAMEISKGTISILDKDGIVFNRVWCIYELYRTMLDSANVTDHDDSKQRTKTRYCVYTAHKHNFEYSIDILPRWTKWIPCVSRPIRYILSGKQIRYDEHARKAVGLCPGGAPCDRIGAHARANRESYFPFQLIQTSIQVKVEKAQSSFDSDRVHILNSIIGRKGDELNATPPESHPKYAELNNTLTANFAASEGALQSALKAGGEKWNAVLKAMAHGQPKLEEMTFNFKKGLGWDGMTTDQAVEMVHHLPLAITEIQISHAPFGPRFMAALADWIERSIGLKKLSIGHTLAGDEAGADLARAISLNSSIEWFSLYKTDLMSIENASNWSDTFSTNHSLITVCTTAKYTASTARKSCCSCIWSKKEEERQQQESVIYGNQIDCEEGLEVCYKDCEKVNVGFLEGEGFRMVCEGLSQNISIQKFYIENHGVGKQDIAEIIPLLRENKSLKRLQFWEGKKGNITWALPLLRIRFAFFCGGPSVKYSHWKHFYASWSPAVVREVQRTAACKISILVLKVILLICVPVADFFIMDYIYESYDAINGGTTSVLFLLLVAFSCYIICTFGTIWRNTSLSATVD